MDKSRETSVSSWKFPTPVNSQQIEEARSSLSKLLCAEKTKAREEFRTSCAAMKFQRLNHAPVSSPKVTNLQIELARLKLYKKLYAAAKIEANFQRLFDWRST